MQASSYDTAMAWHLRPFISCAGWRGVCVRIRTNIASVYHDSDLSHLLIALVEVVRMPVD